MSYAKIFHQAYTLTIRNPLMWLFGLVMLGGFNLSLINFLQFIPSESRKFLLLPIYIFENPTSYESLSTFVVVGLFFLLFNFIKVKFVVFAHNLIHDSKPDCKLCVHVKEKTKRDFVWWGKSMLASFITIIVTTVVGLLVNLVLNQLQPGGSGALFVNIIFLVVVTCTIGVWNSLMAYFIVFHDLSFDKSSQLAIGLLVSRVRRIVEFVLLLSTIYTLTVVIGDALIKHWNSGNGIVFLVMFVVWFAVNNIFFNLAFLIFFDGLVKASNSENPEVLPQPL